MRGGGSTPGGGSGTSEAQHPVRERAREDDALRWHVLRSTVANVVGKVVTLGTWFFLTPFILHRVGPTGYGLWALVGSVVAYGALLDFGIGPAVTKYVAEFHARGDLERAKRLVATAFWLYAAIGLLALGLAAALAPLVPDLFRIPASERATAEWLTVVAGAAVAVELPATTTYSALRGLQQFEAMAVISATGVVLVAGATVGVLEAGGGLVGVVAVNIPLTVVMQVPMMRLLRRHLPGFGLGLRHASRADVRTVASFSSALFLINAGAQINRKTDEIVIGAFLPVARIAPYSIARRLSDMPQVIADQFVSVLLPLASQVDAQDDRARMRALLLTSTRLTMAAFLPIACPLVVLAGPFLAVWVGPSYERSAWIVVLLTAAAFVSMVAWPAAAVLQAMVRHRVLALFSLGTAALNLGLSLALIGPLGVRGVAASTLIAMGIETLVFVLPFAMRANGIPLHRLFEESLLPALLPAVPCLLVLVGLRDLASPGSYFSIAWIGLVGAATYLAAYFALRPGEAERVLLRRAAAAVRPVAARAGGRA